MGFDGAWGYVGMPGMWGYTGHVVGYEEICVICGTDHLPEIGPVVLPFLIPPPQSLKVGK